MTFEEAVKVFDLPLEQLKKYISFGFIRKTEGDDTTQYKDSEFSQLGLIDT